MNAKALAVLVLLTACAPKEVAPVDLLPRDTFTEVLLQAHLTEAGPVSASDSAWAALFQAHGTDERHFRETYAWYAEHPAELKAVYNDVLTRLQQRVDRPDSAAVTH